MKPGIVYIIGKSEESAQNTGNQPFVPKQFGHNNRANFSDLNAVRVCR